MEIPNEIVVCGHKIEVEKVRSSTEAELGSYRGWYQKININVDDTVEDMQAETFLHEIIEVIRNKFNLKIEHSELTIISEVLFDVLRRNELCFVEKKPDSACKEPNSADAPILKRDYVSGSGRGRRER